MTRIAYSNLSVLPSARKPRRGIGPAHLKGLSDPGPGITIWGDVMPCQVDNGRGWTGEQRLCEGVLWDAMACLRGVHGKLEQENAARWFQNTSSVYTFDFETICHILGLDAGRVRAGVLGRREAA